jgi:hypothetical protein
MMGIGVPQLAFTPQSVTQPPGGFFRPNSMVIGGDGVNSGF